MERRGWTWRLSGKNGAMMIERDVCFDDVTRGVKKN